MKQKVFSLRIRSVLNASIVSSNVAPKTTLQSRRARTACAAATLGRWPALISPDGYSFPHRPRVAQRGWTVGNSTNERRLPHTSVALAEFLQKVTQFVILREEGLQRSVFNEQLAWQQKKTPKSVNAVRLRARFMSASWHAVGCTSQVLSLLLFADSLDNKTGPLYKCSFAVKGGKKKSFYETACKCRLLLNPLVKSLRRLYVSNVAAACCFKAQ